MVFLVMVSQHVGAVIGLYILVYIHIYFLNR